jgi:hypothetical protein
LFAKLMLIQGDQVETQRADEDIPAEKTTTVTRTETGFQTVSFTVDISGVTRTATHIAAPTDVRFLHDGIAPPKTEVPLAPVIVTANPYHPAAPMEVQLDSGGDDDTVVQETMTVYPLKTLLPETEIQEPTITLSPIDASDFPFHTVTLFPTAQNPHSASLFTNITEVEPTKTVNVKASVTISSASLLPTSSVSYLPVPGLSPPYITNPSTVTSLPNEGKDSSLAAYDS